MAEQHTDVSDIHAQNVTVAPTQIVVGASGPAVRGWTEALLRGPLERSGLTERAECAQQLRDGGDHGAAAVELEAIAEELMRAGYDPAAEAYLDRAASAHADAGHREEARSRYLHLARARLARATLGDGSLDALSGP